MIIDLIFLILLIVAFLKGIKKGLIKALFTFFAFFIGLAAAIKLSAVVANRMATHNSGFLKWYPFLCFILVFAIVVILVNAMGRFLEKTSEVVMLGWINKLGGVLFYLFLYGIFYSIIIFYLKNLGILKAQTIEASKFYPYISPIAPDALSLLGKIIPFFKDLFSQLEHYFDLVSKKL